MIPCHVFVFSFFFHIFNIIHQKSFFSLLILPFILLGFQFFKKAI
jgi:hypothetical protein